jgi:four helix bundle protein
MVNNSFVNLKVYQMAELLADKIWKIVCKWDSFARDTIGKQLVRGVDSIGANIAEGSGRGTFRDNRRFVLIARGSLFETRHWLRRAFARELLTVSQTREVKPIVENVGPMLNGFLRSIGKTKAAKRVTNN